MRYLKTGIKLSVTMLNKFITELDSLLIIFNSHDKP